jgi:hypothetical protein
MTVISWKARHPERHAKASERQHSRIARKLAKGRAGKDALMPKARAIASSGACAGWLHVLTAMEHLGFDTVLLRIWATAGDKDEIDRICVRSRAVPKRRS